MNEKGLSGLDLFDAESDLLKVVLSAEVDIRVPFYDLDPLGVVWHGNYYNYFELARAALMRNLGFDIEEMRRSGYVWPVVKSHCDYLSPLRYNSLAVVRAEVKEAEHRLVLHYRISDKETGKILAKGYTVQVAVKTDTWEMCFDTPSVLLDRVNDARKKRGL
jgi:acyl-CoA thioester hydrolase